MLLLLFCLFVMFRLHGRALLMNSLSLSRARAGDGPRAQLAITQRTSLLTLTYDVSISRTH